MTDLVTQNGSRGSARTPTLSSRHHVHVWKTLEDLFGKVTNQASIDERYRNVDMLCESGADPAEIAIRANRWPYHFGDATLTDRALAKHWDTLGRPPVKASKTQLAQLEREEERLRKKALITEGKQ